VEKSDIHTYFMKKEAFSIHHLILIALPTHKKTSQTLFAKFFYVFI